MEAARGTRDFHSVIAFGGFNFRRESESDGQICPRAGAAAEEDCPRFPSYSFL